MKIKSLLYTDLTEVSQSFGGGNSSVRTDGHISRNLPGSPNRRLDFVGGNPAVRKDILSQFGGSPSFRKDGEYFLAAARPSERISCRSSAAARPSERTANIFRNLPVMPNPYSKKKY
jgi:hypothetical protein